jgi:hypothetical protein
MFNVDSHKSITVGGVNLDYICPNKTLLCPQQISNFNTLIQRSTYTREDFILILFLKVAISSPPAKYDGTVHLKTPMVNLGRL